MTDENQDLAAAEQGPPPEAPTPPADDSEYEYVDEDGNPVSPPPEGLNPEEYEVVEEPAPEAAPAAAPAAEPAAAKPAEPPRPSSTRKLPDRKSARGSQRPPPPPKPHSRTKAYLLLGMFLSVPLLIILILAVYWYRFHYLPAHQPVQRRVVASPSQEGMDIKKATAGVLDQANALYEAGKEAEAGQLYAKAKADFERAVQLLQGYDQDIIAIRAQLRHINERLYIIEMRQLNKNRPPAPPAAPATDKPTPPASENPTPPAAETKPE